MSATPRRSRLRRPLAGALAPLLFVIALLAGCTTASQQEQIPDPQAELDQFITHLRALESDDAAAMTSNAGTAGQMLAAVLDDLDPKDLQITPGAWNRVDDTEATVPVTYSWQLSDAGIWKYDATWTWHRAGSGEKARWVLDWDPTVIHPELGARQTLAVRTTEADAGALVDRNNQTLVSPVTVFAVQASPTKIADPQATAAQLVKLLKKYDPTLTPEGIVTGIAEADKSIGYTVINLREAEFEQVQQKLAEIDGLTFPSQVRNLGPTKDFARAWISQVEPVADGLSQGKQGWRIVSVDSTGAEVSTLAESEPEAGAKVMLTIDLQAQTAAEKALAGIGEQAALVAIQPSTGDILAVAQNAAANAEGPIALMGRYPPGSIFKIVTATAAFDNKLVTPETVVPCPGEWSINYRPIRNEDSFDLGEVPVTTAFAKSCNTTFAELASQLPDKALTETAKQYSIGLDFVIPGITTLTGQAPLPANQVEQAEDGFGQGVILVSPFSAALMAATAATDNLPVPTLIKSEKTEVDQDIPPRSKTAQQAIKKLMRAVVTDGTATVLQDVGTTYAKTGTAEYTDEQGELHAHAWTVGFTDKDIAFSVLIVGGESSKRTNDIARAFLLDYPSS